MQELTELQYVTEGEITGAGISALEPYRAKRAIFIAAGFGSRLVPITLTPRNHWYVCMDSVLLTD